MVNSLVIEQELFSEKYYPDIHKYLSTSTETINLLEALDYIDSSSYVKKDVSMLLLQMLVVNYFSTTHVLYNPQADWVIPYMHTLKSFLLSAQNTYSKYSDIFQNNNRNNPFLTVRRSLTPLGYKVLEISNSFFIELYKDTKELFTGHVVSNAWDILLSEFTMKKYYKIFIKIFQVLFEEECPKEGFTCSELFSPYSGIEGYEGRCEHYAHVRMKRFIGNLLIFSYTCNNGWITPRIKKGYTKSNPSVDILLKIYNGENIISPSSGDIWYSIEKAIPNLKDNLCKLDDTEFISNKNIKEFSKVYPKYYAGELTKNDLFKMFNIKEATFQKWVGELDLPIKTGRFEALEIPANFESMYYKFLEGEVSKPKLLKDLNVSDRTLYTWIKGKGLPLKKDYTKNLKIQPTTVSVEPSVQVLPIEKPTLKFSLFGYEFSFTAKKKEPQVESINLSDEFPDEIEY